MAFTRNTLNSLSELSSGGVRKWIYTTEDSVTDVVFPNYFGPSWIELNDGDLIDVIASDGNIAVQVTGTSLNSVAVGPVTSGGGSVLERAFYTMPASEINSLNSAQPTIVPAAGPDTWIRLITVDMHYRAGTTPFTVSDPTTAMGIGNFTGTEEFEPFLLDGFITQSSDRFAYFKPSNSATGGADINSNPLNKRVLVYLFDGANPSAGDGEIDFYVTYLVNTLV